MNKKDFPSVLKDISPKILIDENSKKDVQSFFLILGLVFNDLKGLIFFLKIIEDNYRKPGVDEVSAHAGEYNGLIIQADKLLISTVGEFFKFIEENKTVINSMPFLLLIKKLDETNRNTWNDLMKLDQGSTVLSKIARIRSNVAFHYDNSMEELRKGFIGGFFSKRRDLVQHKRAYYSLGNTMETTRMYFSDAAVEDYIHGFLNIDDRTKIRIAIESMNHAIRALLKVYLQSIKK